MRAWIWAVLLLGAGQVMAADYSVAPLRPISPTGYDPGNGINLYEITAKGVELMKGSPYVFRHKDQHGTLSSLLFLQMNPAHDFVYAVFTGDDEPILAGFAVTCKGLVLRWQQPFNTGDSDMEQATVTVLDNFIIEDTHPAPFAHVESVVDQSGRLIRSEMSQFLISARVNSNGNFYYSCRSSTATAYGGAPPPNQVLVFDLRKSAAEPVTRSNDPVFVRSICN
jgi:hypothetical protein